MTWIVRAASTDQRMTREMVFRRTLDAAELRRRRRAAANLLRPCLGSTRLVKLFHDITLLAVCQPEQLRTLEVLVEGLHARRPAAAELKGTATRQRA